MHSPPNIYISPWLPVTPGHGNRLAIAQGPIFLFLNPSPSPSRTLARVRDPCSHNVITTLQRAQPRVCHSPATRLPRVCHASTTPLPRLFHASYHTSATRLATRLATLLPRSCHAPATLLSRICRAAATRQATLLPPVSTLPFRVCQSCESRVA